MKKTLIALALATLPVASMADVVLYGQIKGGVEVTKVKGESGTTTAIVDYGSRIGFKGQENLKGDINAIWQLESKVNIGGGDDAEGHAAGFGTRDSFIGLQSDSLGTVKAGYQQTPVAEMNGDLDQWEYFDSNEYAAGLGLFTRGTDAASRRLALSYETPVFSGFSAKAFVSPSDNNERKDATGKKIGGDSAVYGLGLKYVQNPEADKMGWFGGLAGTYVRNGANNLYYTAPKPTDAKKYGYQALAQVGYEGQQWFAGLAYQHAENVDGVLYGEKITKMNEVAASVAYSPDEVLTLKASAAMGFGIKHLPDGGTKSEKLSNGKYYQAVVGADYNLSKRTTLNGQLGYLQAGRSSDNVRGGTLSVGMKHRF